jgi:excisionase family DNA binding protein
MKVALKANPWVFVPPTAYGALADLRKLPRLPCDHVGEAGLSAHERLGRIVGPDTLELLAVFVTEQIEEVLRRPERPWLTLDEAAERLGCSRDAVRMRVKRGRLEARHQGRRVYISADSVERLA